MPTYTTTPFHPRPRRIFTRSMQEAGYRRLLLAIDNHERVKNMTHAQLATYLEHMADEEHGWTTRHEVLKAVARILAPEQFDDAGESGL